jgi:hypothetical protein
MVISESRIPPVEPIFPVEINGRIVSILRFLGLSPLESRCIELKLVLSKTGSEHIAATHDGQVKHHFLR